MAAGRSTDEPFWDNYSGYSNHRSGCAAMKNPARARPDRGTADWAHAHTCCVLTLAVHPSWHIEKLLPHHCCSNCSFFFYYPPNPDISYFIKLGRYAYHELFWHGDLLIFTGNISSHQSVPGVVVAGRMQGWDWIQIIWGAIMSDVCAHLIKAPITHCCRGRGCMHQKTNFNRNIYCI